MGRLLLCLCFLSIASAALAIWPNDPAQNLAIATRPGEQVVPKVATAPDGSCYVSWFDNASGNYDVYLQHLDRFGNETWPHNGILVSDHPQSTSLVDWDLIADSHGHGIVVFTDTRDDVNLDVYAYRISPSGQFLWGADGIHLSLPGDVDYEVHPQCAELSDGNFVFAWPRLPDAGTGAIMVQKVSPEGAVLFDPAMQIPGEANRNPAFCRVVASNDGGFIVSWVRDIKMYQSPRHIHAQKFSADGTALWGAQPVIVYDAVSVPIAHWPLLLSDGAGGAVFGWHASVGNVFGSFTQHVNAAGLERFPHNGVSVSTLANTHHIDPTFAYRAASDEIFVFWTPRNLAQSQWGLYAQKITAAGTRAWTDNGRTLLPINTVWKDLARSAPIGDGAEVVLFDEPTGMGNDRVIAMRLDSSGGSVWGPTPVVVSAVVSSKSRLPISMRSDGITIAVWEDGRNGTPDVYAQSLNPDGTLGIAAASVEASAGPPAALCGASRPNPFSSWTEIVVRTREGQQRVQVLDAAGRIVRTLVARPSGTGVAVARWDGQDARGRPIPNGTYFYRLDGRGSSAPLGKVALLR